MDRSERDADITNFVTTWTVDNPPYVILKWTIENLQYAETVLKSPCFEISQTSKWHLLLDPNVVIDGDMFVAIYLKKSASSPSERYMLKGELSVHGPKNELMFDKLFDEIYDNDSIEFRMTKLIFPLRPSSDDIYLVRCEMVISREINSIDGSRSHLQKLSEDYKKLYYDNKFTDISIRAIDDIIYSHKTFLHARSPFFAKELEKNGIFLTEKNPYLSAVLLYLYTGDPDLLLSSVPLEMFGIIHKIATRWQLNELVNLLTPFKMNCKTCISNEFFQYTWEVKNFTKFDTDSPGVLHSSEFTTKEEAGARWRLGLEKHLEGRSDFYGLYLEKISSSISSHKTSVEFQVYNKKGNSVIRRRDYIFGPRPNQKCGFSSIVDASFVQNCNNNNDDILKVVCVLKIHLESDSWIHFKSTSTDITDKAMCFLKYLKVLSGNFKDLYNTKTYSDLKLFAGEETIPVHKAILWARSPYFTSILSDFSTEHIAIPVQPDIMKGILLYMYSAQLPDLNLENMQKMYEATVLLKLTELFSVCQSYILLHITVDNVLEIIVLAHKYEDTELKKVSEKFASTPGNAKMFLNTQRWRTFKDRHTDLADRIYHNLSWSFCNYF